MEAQIEVEKQEYLCLRVQVINTMGRLVDFISFWYNQYILHTALYMLEPWERKLFSILENGIYRSTAYSHILQLQQGQVVRFDGHLKFEDLVDCVVVLCGENREKIF